MREHQGEEESGAGGKREGRETKGEGRKEALGSRALVRVSSISALLSALTFYHLPGELAWTLQGSRFIYKIRQLITGSLGKSGEKDPKYPLCSNNKMSFHLLPSQHYFFFF